MHFKTTAHTTTSSSSSTRSTAIVLSILVCVLALGCSAAFAAMLYFPTWISFSTSTVNPSDSGIGRIVVEFGLRSGVACFTRTTSPLSTVCSGIEFVSIPSAAHIDYTGFVALYVGAVGAGFFGAFGLSVFVLVILLARCNPRFLLRLIPFIFGFIGFGLMTATMVWYTVRIDRSLDAEISDSTALSIFPTYSKFDWAYTVAWIAGSGLPVLLLTLVLIIPRDASATDWAVASSKHDAFVLATPNKGAAVRELELGMLSTPTYLKEAGGGGGHVRSPSSDTASHEASVRLASSPMSSPQAPKLPSSPPPPSHASRADVVARHAVTSPSSPDPRLITSNNRA